MTPDLTPHMFFRVWNVRFNPACFGQEKTDGSRHVAPIYSSQGGKYQQLIREATHIVFRQTTTINGVKNSQFPSRKIKFPVKNFMIIRYSVSILNCVSPKLVWGLMISQLAYYQFSLNFLVQKFVSLVFNKKSILKFVNSNWQVKKCKDLDSV